MQLDDLFQDARRQFQSSNAKGRRYAIGMLIALIDLVRAAKGQRTFSSLEEFFASFPRVVQRGNGPLSTLTITVHGKDLGIRRYFNEAEEFFRVQHNRWDFPKAPAHATSKWQQFEPWLETIVRSSDGDLIELRARAVEFVLATLPDQGFSDSDAPERMAPPLSAFLQGFQFTRRAPQEREGAALQATVFGYLRADNPHLQVEPRGSRTGSRRQKGVGDIDCWDAKRLVVSAEVKQHRFRSMHVSAIKPFALEVRRRVALGFVAALEFEDAARAELLALGVTPLSIADMVAVVAYWDRIKQITAIKALIYHVAQIERSSPLLDRIESYLMSAKISEELELPEVVSLTKIN